MKDARGQELEVGSYVAVACQSGVYTGFIVDIKENNSKWYRNAIEQAANEEIRANYRNWYQKYIEKCPLLYKIRKDEDGTMKRVEYYKRLLVISPLPATIEK